MFENFPPLSEHFHAAQFIYRRTDGGIARRRREL